MALFVLMILAVLISRYAKRRSKVIYLSHFALFVVYFLLALFTAKDISVIAYPMRIVFGEERYNRICFIMQTPGGWLYSIGAAVFSVELIMLVIIAILGTLYAAEKIVDFIKKKNFNDVNTDERKEAVRHNIIADRKIFLRYCRLLN